MRFRIFALAVLVLSGVLQAQGMESLTLNMVRFAENREVELNMLPTRRVGDAQMKGKVRFRDGQFWIELEYRRMKPAVLFGGEVTCYVLWAVNRDGAPQNLGELWIRPDESDGTVRYSTGLRNFALLVTAEAYFQVDEPSSVVVFWNDSKPDPPVPTDPLAFSDFAEAPRIGVETIANVRYDGSKPLDLVQAEMVYDYAQKMNADEYAPDLFAQATLTLEQATHMYERSRDRGSQQYARRSVAATNEAIRMAKRQQEIEQIEALIAQRQAEMEQLEVRADQAESRAEEALSQVSAAEARTVEAQEALRRITQEREEAMTAVQGMTRQLETMRSETQQLESRIEALRAEGEQMRVSMDELRTEKSTLESRLQSALSEVAETRDSARGYIVNLPDILFDVGQASLRPQAQVALAKLAGILLIMQDLNVRVEGHTDSTGSPSFNQRLSERRADAVFDLLVQEGIPSTRITTEGYGMERPIADNSTTQGRQQNRRVEIIIAEGVIGEESN